jgi:hypothetical protein
LDENRIFSPIGRCQEREKSEVAFNEEAAAIFTREDPTVRQTANGLPQNAPQTGRSNNNKRVPLMGRATSKDWVRFFNFFLNY